MFCVECGRKAEKISKQSVICKFCKNKLDKYEAMCSTYKYIDCLLMKLNVFNHYLLNNSLDIGRLIKHLIMQITCLLFVNEVKIVIELCFYLTVVIMLWGKAKPYRVVFSILFSSFFNYFKVLICLWKY